jgi:hypothetical protein
MKMTGKVLFTTKTLSSQRYYRVLYLNIFFKSSVCSVRSVVNSFAIYFHKISVYSVRPPRRMVNYSDNYFYTFNG